MLLIHGTPLESVSTGIRDLAKGVQLSSKEGRVAGQDLVKLSQRGLAQKVDDKLRKFV